LGVQAEARAALCLGRDSAVGDDRPCQRHLQAVNDYNRYFEY
jgi:hypothetical protein